jgi:hypothetical protein
MQSLADNYETMITGELFHTTTLGERFLTIGKSQPLLAGLLQRPESTVVVPMSETNLEPEINRWAASLQDDALIEHCYQTMLVAAAEGHTTISSATHGAPRTNLFPGLGVDRRFKHGETGLDPTEYCIYDTNGSYCIVKNDAGNTAKNLDGQNVFTRNSLRLLRSRISQFSKHETISSILKELVEASQELNVPYALFSGDGAPCIQINNRRRKAAHVYLSQSIARKPKANTQRGVCSLPPEMPRTPHEMQAFLQLFAR